MGHLGHLYTSVPGRPLQPGPEETMKTQNLDEASYFIFSGKIINKQKSLSPTFTTPHSYFKIVVTFPRLNMSPLNKKRHVI